MVLLYEVKECGTKFWNYKSYANYGENGWNVNNPLYLLFHSETHTRVFWSNCDCGQNVVFFLWVIRVKLLVSTSVHLVKILWKWLLFFQPQFPLGWIVDDHFGLSGNHFRGCRCKATGYKFQQVYFLKKAAILTTVLQLQITVRMPGRLTWCYAWN